MALKQFEITVHGRVQGVGFRYAALTQARSLGLKGWVENRPDGTVLAMINGSQQACDHFVRWCHTGSGYSWVDHVDIKEKEPEALQGFRIRH
jgi:acylphosphatase